MQFRGRVLKPGGELITVLVDAIDQDAARAQLSQQGDTVLQLRPQSRFFSQHLMGGRRLDVSLFTEELITLLDAGLTLGEALETLLHNQPSAEAKQRIARIHELLSQGQPFSAALGAQGKTFPSLYCATVRSAERTGHLAQALTRYLDYQRQMEMLRKQVISASIYPLLLVGVGSLVIGFLLTYVVPRFATVYHNAGRQPPASTRILLSIGEALTQHGAMLAGGLLVVGVTLVIAWQRPALRAAVIGVLWRTPGMTEPLRVFHLARFYRSLSMLLEGGIPVVQALDMVTPLLGAPLLPGAARARNALQQGRSVSQAFTQGQLTTPVAERLLRVGERSGRMGAMMQSIARFLDEATARRVGWITQLFEPLLMIVIGLTVGMIVVLLYMPIFDLTGVFQ